jgi:hypothetical protein
MDFSSCAVRAWTWFGWPCIALAGAACGGQNFTTSTGGPSDGAADATRMSDASSDATVGPMDGSAGDTGGSPRDSSTPPTDGSSPPRDAGVEAGLCGACTSTETCCTNPGSGQYGMCYPSGCGSCCSGGPPPPQDSGATDSGKADAGVDAGLCGMCDAGDVCCLIPNSSHYGQCYSHLCLSCCM